MPFFKSVSVSIHAIDRWRERAAVYANESMYDVLRAFDKATRVADNAPVPVSRKEDSVYFYNQQHDIYFVLRVFNNRKALITTVVRFSDFCDQQPMIETEMIEVPQEPIRERTRLEQLQELIEERNSLKTDFHDLQRQLNSGELSKRERHSACTKLKSVQDHIKKVKEELRKFSNAEKGEVGKIKSIATREAAIPDEVSERREQLKAEREKLLQEIRLAHAYNEKEAIVLLQEKINTVKQELKELAS